MIPLDVLSLVADHIPPNLVRYNQLVTVDRIFNAVFTSDRQWVFLNPYGLESGIASDFASNVASKEFCKAILDPNSIHNYTQCRKSKYVQLVGAIHNLETGIEDEQLAWCAVNIYGRSLSNLAPALRNNYKFVLAAVRQDGTAIAAAGPEYAQDMRIILAALASNPRAIDFVDLADITSSTDFVSICEALTPESSMRIAYNREQDIVHLGLPTFDYAIMSASQSLRDNKEIVRAAIMQSPGAIKQASRRLQLDRELVSLAISKQPELICDGAFTDDFEMVLLAVKQRGLCLMWASTRLRDNEEIVRAAIADSPEVLRFATKRLQQKLSTLLYAASFPILGPLASSLYSVYPF